jgi:hypothetical protein
VIQWRANRNRRSGIPELSMALRRSSPELLISYKTCTSSPVVNVGLLAAPPQVIWQRSKPTRISLKMKRTAAPFFRSDVGDSLGEVPAVATKVLSIVLALAVGLVFRLGEDDGSILPRALTVTLGVLDPDLNDM